MKKDMFKYIGGCMAMTAIAVFGCGIYGGLEYLFDRDDIVTKQELERQKIVTELQFEPLTQNEIELIERLKETTIKDGDLNNYKEVPSAESETTHP